MAYVSRNRSILRMPNTTVPLQGAFVEDLCKTTKLNGLMIILFIRFYTELIAL